MVSWEDDSPDQVEGAMTSKCPRKVWKRKVEEEWNHRPDDEGLRTRRMPKAK